MPINILQSGGDGFTIQINILADTRYISTNYTEVSLNVDDLRIDPAIRGWFSTPITPSAATQYFIQRSNYEIVRETALSNANWQGFITELAAPTEHLLAEMGDETREEGFYFRTDLQNTPEVVATLESYGYLTRLYGVIPAFSDKSPLEAI